jgi:hypothetical protein
MELDRLTPENFLQQLNGGRVDIPVVNGRDIPIVNDGSWLCSRFIS